MIEETYNPENNLVSVVLLGEISFDEFINWEMELTKNKYSVKKLRVLLDVTQGKYNLKMEDILPLKSLIVENVDKFDAVYLAAVHGKPYETAFSHMFNQSVRIDKFHHKTFSFTDNAIKWLLSNE